MEQKYWQQTLDESGFTITAFVREFKLRRASVKKWLSCETEPRAKNIFIMEEALKKVEKAKRIDRHPSYGYATPEQIETLQKIGLGPDRDQIMKQIAKQNEHHGKVFY